MHIEFSIKVVTGNESAWVLSKTEVAITGNKELIDRIITKIKEIPDVEVE